MFIRFVSGEINEDSRLPAGLFCAALDLLDSNELPKYEADLLRELKEWFDLYLRSPSDYLVVTPRNDSAICWFKSTAREHLSRAWELVEILERNDVMIWTVRSPRVGYIYYEDDVQVFARPHSDVRRLF